MKRGARVGDVGACRFDGAMLGVYQVDLRDARRSRRGLRARGNPSRSRNRRHDPRGRRADAGEQRRAVVDAIPGEDAGLAEPRAVADRPQRSEVAPVVGRAPVGARQPEDAAMELRQRAVEAERLADLLLQAGGAIVVGARADQRAALGEQRPAARDVGEVLLLVLGQQDLAEPVRAALDARHDRPAGLLQAEILRPERLLGVDVLEGGSSARRKNARCGRERSGLEGVDEGAAGLAHGPERPVP